MLLLFGAPSSLVLRGRKSLAFPRLCHNDVFWFEVKLSHILSQRFNGIPSLVVILVVYLRVIVCKFNITQSDIYRVTLFCPLGKNRELLLIYSRLDSTQSTQFNFLLSDTHSAPFCLTKHLLLISSSRKRITHLISAFSRMWPLHFVSDLCLVKIIWSWSNKSFCTEMSYEGKIKCILVWDLDSAAVWISYCPWCSQILECHKLEKMSLENGLIPHLVAPPL